MPDTTLIEFIEETAQQAKSVTVDGQQLVRRSLGELIEADRHIRSSSATATRGFGLRFQKLVPPGGG